MKFTCIADTASQGSNAEREDDTGGNGGVGCDCYGDSRGGDEHTANAEACHGVETNYCTWDVGHDTGAVMKTVAKTRSSLLCPLNQKIAALTTTAPKVVDKAWRETFEIYKDRVGWEDLAEQKGEEVEQGVEVRALMGKFVDILH